MRQMIAGVLCVLGLALPAYAALNQTQCTVLSNDILTVHQVEFQDLIVGGSVVGLQQAYAQPATPDFWVLKTTLTLEELYESPSPTGSLWNWPVFRARSVADKDVWREMFAARADKQVNPSLPNFDDGVNDAFNGTAADVVAQRNHIFAHARRLALRSEQLFATTPGDGTTGAPATMTVEGAFSNDDVTFALQQRCAELP
jgi:hypothetical protein